MASRPVFLPVVEGSALVEERSFDFPWASGFAEVQKKKNIHSLHARARESGISNILEISTKSDEKVGRHLSAFSLKIYIGNEKFPLESVYQGAKVFEEGGPYPEIFSMSPREAKKFIRSEDRGNLLRFELDGKRFPLIPKNAFYDWLYIRSLVDHTDWIVKNVQYDAFTDIEFNPNKQVNCQARAFAEFISLVERKKIFDAAKDFTVFSNYLPAI
ncbi:DarT1-associated NADAR antitoxin family protein [Thalassospira indica]|uniref:Uncharacterized protein n=1 Tax=Thalassospira indica TaxID=1891279 RepID=A0ABM6Y448_9PROT|nr:hypothetical protein [Thalassospira indica]AXO16621.1 hypothetical protein DY252_22150 [Thalassospira indica]